MAKKLVDYTGGEFLAVLQKNGGDPELIAADVGESLDSVVSRFRKLVDASVAKKLSDVAKQRKIDLAAFAKSEEGKEIRKKSRDFVWTKIGEKFPRPKRGRQSSDANYVSIDID